MAKAYIETTIPSYYVAKLSGSLSQAARQASTRQWWDSGCSGFDLYTSLETFDEAAKGDKEMALARKSLLDSCQLLSVTDQEPDLIGFYIGHIRLGAFKGCFRCLAYCRGIRLQDRLPCDVEF